MGSPNRIEYRVTARNTATASENRLHTDDVARRYGFRGGLVPGGTVYAYATYPVVQVLGERWLAHGRARVRFVSPCYDGEDLTVTVVAGTSTSVDFEARAGGRICAAGSASLISASSPGEEVDAIPAATPPRSATDHRPARVPSSSARCWARSTFEPIQRRP